MPHAVDDAELTPALSQPLAEAAAPHVAGALEMMRFAADRMLLPLVVLAGLVCASLVIRALLMLEQAPSFL